MGHTADQVKGIARANDDVVVRGYEGSGGRHIYADQVAVKVTGRLLPVTLTAT